ncbi:septal ring lytic transglycosylase RlpA family protein [Colwellia sp. MB02u-10]|jgi:rare lipoprotein A|uniref:septal ring lytic transglycosylase RlpA family protein n=1 Tax=Colwellia sp. MB02u-10 TaxID=2759828 RepID=UPI0015F3BA9E|nr:septal ring lytic transglycosylase RlpA family protein [Colwellia sp. MB02u-10]MBA6342071.1 septal ring lytic transglycosylase RlpA family protein [Colwellia sp. MB02u-10]
MAKLNINHPIYLCVLIILVSACSANYGRYQQKNDSTPSRLPTASELHDATPRAEAFSLGGNKHYQVRGEDYQVLNSAENFSQAGTASWYGRKFHGHLTSNGEIYDMYAMSAAHKNLPLPSYLRVVNNSNGLSVIVRVNDRGPFHQSRIIDLSYSAAYKLDMLKTGTADVTITAITDFTLNGLAKLQDSNQRPTNSAKKITPLPKTTLSVATETIAARKIDLETATPSLLKVTPTAQYIQVFASRSHTQATKIAKVLIQKHQINTLLEQINGIFRVLVGPIERSDELARLLLVIKADGYPKAFIRQ